MGYILNKNKKYKDYESGIYGKSKSIIFSLSDVVENEIATEIFTILEAKDKSYVDKYTNSALANYYIENIKPTTLFADWKPSARALEIISDNRTVESEFPNGIYVRKKSKK